MNEHPSNQSRRPYTFLFNFTRTLGRTTKRLRCSARYPITARLRTIEPTRAPLTRVKESQTTEQPAVRERPSKSTGASRSVRQVVCSHCLLKFADKMNNIWRGLAHRPSHHRDLGWCQRVLIQARSAPLHHDKRKGYSVLCTYATRTS